MVVVPSTACETIECTPYRDVGLLDNLVPWLNSFNSAKLPEVAEVEGFPTGRGPESWKFGDNYVCFSPRIHTGNR